MPDYNWPSSPLVKVTTIKPKATPYYRSEWTPDDEGIYPVEVDVINFDVELVADSESSSDTFRIGVETVDDSHNTIQVVHPPQEYYVQKGHTKSFTLAVPPIVPLTQFRVTIEHLIDSSLSGTQNWTVPESRVFKALYVPVEEVSKKLCFIATAAYGTELAPPVQFLRKFRDDVLLQSRFSRFLGNLLKVYYKFSPTIARAMILNKPFKYVMRYMVVWPVVAIVGISAFTINCLRRQR